MPTTDLVVASIDAANRRRYWRLRTELILWLDSLFDEGPPMPRQEVREQVLGVMKRSAAKAEAAIETR